MPAVELQELSGLPPSEQAAGVQSCRYSMLCADGHDSVVESPSLQRVEAGEVDILDSAALRDRYQQVTATAHGLLADLCEVEADFRELG